MIEWEFNSAKILAGGGKRNVSAHHLDPKPLSGQLRKKEQMEFSVLEKLPVTAALDPAFRWGCIAPTADAGETSSWSGKASPEPPRRVKRR
ncbi:hypothetical protein N7539_002936 [Penicillium diatomitis]|uniref:Uncharacterized protein n=1 Tax=Penicillium diatomitis TaxID=2819901 RepID=A0A9X0BZC2_9EURO|nr:uncharacterized protein N7539_002936 [Penicillium diatomitis]KAJ5491369.1 hypothetical protein N7539_002936 [Penicillium diatomitis]